jgi:hypothetical protein
MAWLEDHWTAVDETFRLGRVKLPARKRARFLRPVEMRRSVESRANSRSRLDFDFRAEFPMNPLQGAPSAEDPGLEDRRLEDPEIEPLNDDGFDYPSD